MAPTIFKFILQHSMQAQIRLVVLTVIAFPFLYLSLDLPKLIINKAIAGPEDGFPKQFFGLMELEQIPYLLVLCGIFLALVLINGAFKYFINVYRGVVGERMLRRLRYDLFHRVLRFPLPQFRRTGQGELVSMITAETEPLGGYIGDSIALPAFQGGTLLTIVVFMFVQDWKLGLAAITLYPFQAWLIPKLQRKLNLLKKERVVRVRKLSERIGEVVSGIRDVHTHDTSQYELAEYARRMGEIFVLRYAIYKQKFLIKFLNNFIAQVTPFFFYSIGGYLVIKGELTFGALVAVLAAYKDLASPWKELLNFYQIQEDARIKYELLTETFQPGGMLDHRMLEEDPQKSQDFTGALIATNLDLTEEDEGENTFAGNLSFKLALPGHTGVLGPPGSGRDRLAAIVTGLKRPVTGSLTINELDLTRAPEAVVGRQLAYAGNEPVLASGSLRDNLLYSVKHRPTRDPDYTPEQSRQREKDRHEAQLCGNSSLDINADWVNYAALGIDGPEQLTGRAIEVLTAADMDHDIYQLGLHGQVAPDTHPELVERLLMARSEMRTRMAAADLAGLVEPFDKEQYNTNMTVAENLLFGTPIGEAFDLQNLATNPYVDKVLKATQLTEDFLRIGHHVAELMVDLFADVEPGSELFEQFSFIQAQDLPEFRSLLTRADPEQPDSLSANDRRLLLSLPFKLVVARHRLGLIDDPMQARILAARRLFAEGLQDGAPQDGAGVAFFDDRRYNRAVSIQDNILFGRMAYGKARSAPRIGEAISEVVNKLKLRKAVMEVGLDYPVGINGARLTSAQRQKLSLARCLLKNPDLLVLDEATAGLDEASQARIFENLKAWFKGRSLIWNLHRDNLAKGFEQVLVMENGRVVQQGRYQDLDLQGG